jgi:mRNA interferase MazF
MSFTKDFDGWNEYKKKLEVKVSGLYDKVRKKFRFKSGEVWYCSIGVNIGSEICGKNQDFERPVLVVRKSGRHFVGLPLTSEKPNNPLFYYDISYKFNQKEIKSYILTANPKSFDVLRLSRKVRRLNDSDFEKIKIKLSDYLKGGV